MTEPVPEASDVDLAEQSAPVNDVGDDLGTGDFTVSTEADIADVIEQHQEVPLPDDDYDR